MMNSKIQLLKNWAKNSPIIFVLLLVSGLGFLDAGYLTVEHYRAVPVPCSITEGCEKVLGSEYATVYGFPVALLGALYYASLFFIIVASAKIHSEKLYGYILGATSISFMVSMWLLYIQVFILEALCVYCIVSAILSTILFACGIVMVVSKHR